MWFTQYLIFLNVLFWSSTESCDFRYTKIFVNFRLNADMCGLLSILYAVIVIVVGLVVAVAEIYVEEPMPSLFEVCS